ALPIYYRVRPRALSLTSGLGGPVRHPPALHGHPAHRATPPISVHPRLTIFEIPQHTKAPEIIVCGNATTATPVESESRLKPLLPTDPPRIGRYRLNARLGIGGMGQVYLAHTVSGRPVVVKVIRPEHIDDTDFRARFSREAEAARRVGGFHTAQAVDSDP